MGRPHTMLTCSRGLHPRVARAQVRGAGFGLLIHPATPFSGVLNPTLVLGRIRYIHVNWTYKYLIPFFNKRGFFMKERIPRGDIDYRKFTKLRRKVKADMRNGADPGQDRLVQLIDLDRRLGLKYPEWRPNFPAKKWNNFQKLLSNPNSHIPSGSTPYLDKLSRKWYTHNLWIFFR